MTRKKNCHANSHFQLRTVRHSFQPLQLTLLALSCYLSRYLSPRVFWSAPRHWAWRWQKDTWALGTRLPQEGLGMCRMLRSTLLWSRAPCLLRLVPRGQHLTRITKKYTLPGDFQSGYQETDDWMRLLWLLYHLYFNKNSNVRIYPMVDYNDFLPKKNTLFSNIETSSSFLIYYNNDSWLYSCKSLSQKIILTNLQQQFAKNLSITREYDKIRL